MRKSAVKTILFIVSLSVLFILKNLSDMFADIKRINDQIYMFIAKTDCRIPDYEPFDPVAVLYLKEVPPIVCGSPQLALTFMINDTIFINETAVNELKMIEIDAEGVNCTYYNIGRAFNGSEISDDGVVFSNARVFYLLIFIS